MSRLVLAAAALAGVLSFQAAPARADTGDGNAALTRVAIGVATGRVSLCEAITAAGEIARREPRLLRAASDRDSYRAALYAQARRELQTAQTDVWIVRSIADLRCLGDFRDAGTLLAQAQARRVEIVRAEKQQAACQRSPACAAQAVATDLCADLADRREVQGGLAEQHRLARETGAIDLNELADRADALEAIDARVSEEEARFRAIAGRPFDRRVCRSQMAFRAR